jgi:uracil-DNA glycosylase
MSLKRKAADLAAEDARNPKINGNIASFFSAPKPVAAVSTKQTTATSTTTTTAAAANNDGSVTAGTVTAKAKAPVSLSSFVGQPAAPKFDKEAWVAKLSDEQRELLKLEIDTLDVSWLAALRDELTSKSFLELKRFLKREKDSGKTIFPPLHDVYSW